VSILILFATFLILVILGVPLAYALGGASLIYLGIYSPDFLVIIPQRIWSGTNSFVIIAMPLFIMMGEFMNRGGITRRIIDFSLYLVRPFKGGLGEVNVVASMIFGGISGSSVADTSALGSVLIPEMVKRGYSERLSAGITVASSTMGMIIPPSVPMLMYAMISSESVGGLFLAGLIPGLLIGITQLVLVYFVSRRKKLHPPVLKFDPKHFRHTITDGSLAILMPLVIVVVVTFGIATASESAAIAVLYAAVLGMLVYRQMKAKDVFPSLKQTVITSSSVMLVIGCSMIFSWIMGVEQIPMITANFLLGLNISANVLLLIIVAIILFIGMFLDVTPVIILITPILLPIVKQLGVSGLQFGAMMIVGCAIGLVTPPIGMCLNACSKVSRLSIIEIFQGAAPFIICNIIVLLLVTFVPEISTWLPGILMK
jgi:tripartite ATP-independent transporter DctM subunit